LKLFVITLRILLFGDFTEALDQYDLIDLIIWLISTFLVGIILLNMIIAFMGDSIENKSKKNLIFVQNILTLNKSFLTKI